MWIDFADLDPALVFQMRAILRRCDRRLQARLFDQEVPADDLFRLRKRTIDDPPVSHRDGPIFLNVLRVLDVPEALGLLAPKKLTVVNAASPAFDRTAQIYKLAGAEDKLRRK